MARSKPFIFSFIFSIFLCFLFIRIALEKHYQRLFSSLGVELDQLKSKVSVLESSIEKSNHELRRKEDDIAQMEKMILEKEESIKSLKNKVDSIQDYQAWLPPWLAVNVNNFQSFIFAQWNNCWRPALDASFQKILLKTSQVLRDADTCIEMVKTVWIPVLRNQFLTFISSLKPHFDFLTAKTIETYHAFKNSLLSHVVKLQRSAIPFTLGWIQVMKNRSSTFISCLKPHVELVTSETNKAYHASKKFLLSHVVKLRRSATPFMQELQKSAKPRINQIATVTKIYIGKALVSLGTLFNKIIMFLRDSWNN